MRITISTGVGLLVATCVLATADAAFIVEADNVAPAGKAFDHFSATGFSLSATPSAAVGLSGNQSAFGNPNAAPPDIYTFRYTPGLDIDNTAFVPGTVLGNSSVTDADGAGPGAPSYAVASHSATGLPGGLSGIYNVYFTVPPSVNVDPAGSIITINNNLSPVVLNPVDLNNDGTGPNTSGGAVFVGGANSLWLKVATVPLISGNTYTVTVEANSPTFVSQRAHGVMWEFVEPFSVVTPAGELLTNGDFEIGTLGWTIDNLPGGSGSWFTDVPGTTTPISAIATASNPDGGSFYAISDQTGPGTHVLRQAFTVPNNATSVKLSFDMFVNDSDGGPLVNAAGLDHESGPNQHSRVDILTAGAAPFSTAPADIIGNFYLGVDPQVNNPNPYTSYEFDITALVAPGGTYQIRFAEVDNQLFLNHGVDNVSIRAVVPEPAATILLVLAAATFATLRPKMF